LIAALHHKKFRGIQMTKTNIALKWIVVAVFGTLLHMPILAQSMYRCGSTYQDHPCEGTQKNSKVMSGTGVSGSSSAAGTVSDATCMKRGTDAQKIVWAREGGAMLDQQLAKANSVSEQQLINDVYARRGTSSDIRAAIEADCIASKERAAQAAALLDTVRNGQPSAAPLSSGTTGNKAAEAEQKAATSNSNDKIAQEAAQKRIRCNYMNTQLESVASQQRSGGDARTMDYLNQQKLNVQSRMRAEKCE
jgi:hypothetical protein